MKLAGSDYSQQTAGKLLADLRLRTETDFPPLHGRPDCPFGTIVGGLDTIMFEKGEKMLPVVKQPFCSSLYSLVGTVAENNTKIAHPLPHGKSVEQQLLSGATGSLEGMPEGEHCLYFAAHVFGKAIGMGT